MSLISMLLALAVAAICGRMPALAMVTFSSVARSAARTALRSGLFS